METLEKKVGATLRERRENLNLTQAEVAERMKVAVTTVQNIETGEGSPRLNTLKGYCEAVGCAIGDVVKDKPSEQPIRQATRDELLDAVKHAIKVSENSLVQQVIALPSERQSVVKKIIDELRDEQKKPTQSLARVIEEQERRLQELSEYVSDPLFQRLLKCSEDERTELSQRLTIIERRRKLPKTTSKSSKKID